MSADMSPLTRTLHTRSRVLQSFRTANPSLPQQGPNQGTDQSTRVERVLGDLRFVTRVPGGVNQEAPFNGYPPAGVTNLQVNYISYTNPNTYWDATWTPDPFATSYEIQIDFSGALVTQPTDSFVSFIIPNYNATPFTVTIVSVNNLGRAFTSYTAFACFLAGTPVHLVNGIKAIEDVVVGDVVIGAFGEENPVLALQRVLVGHSKMYKINGEHDTTDHHPHVSVDRKFYTPEPAVIGDVYGKSFPVIGAQGPEIMELHGLKGRVQKMELGVELKTIDGSRVIRTLEAYSLPFDTPLYNLVVGGSHTYHANGYAVTGWPREDDFDYDTWVPKA